MISKSEIHNRSISSSFQFFIFFVIFIWRVSEKNPFTILIAT